MWDMETKYGTFFVASAGNNGRVVSSYPPKSQQYLQAMIVVGATNVWAQRSTFSNYERLGDPSTRVEVWAPGEDLPVPLPNFLQSPELAGGRAYGTSFGKFPHHGHHLHTLPRTREVLTISYVATPLVAGLAAYYRGMDPSLGPVELKQLILGNMRSVMYAAGGPAIQKTIFSGYLPTICQNKILFGRQSGGGDSCPAPGNPGSGPYGPSVTYKPGPPGPLCTENCGKLCSGWYCNPAPSGTPPDFSVPKPSQTQTTTKTTSASPTKSTTSTKSTSTTTSTTSTTSSSDSKPTSDPNSPEYKSCQSTLGASTCDSDWCLWMHCLMIGDCIISKFDCLSMSDGKKPTQPDKPGSDSKVCKDCGSDLGSSTCPPDDHSLCLVLECRANLNCLMCQVDCNDYQ